MVNPDLIAAARAFPRRRILVTGGSGFVGSHVARALAAGGHDVVACGRNPYRVPLGPDGPHFERADLADPVRLTELCRGCDLVYHTAALATPWGRREEFLRVNIQGTRNVIAACQQAGVSRLVHVSSTAIQFDYQDQVGVREEAPHANPFACHYAWSKAEAESVVLQATQQGFDAVIIRARALFGEGDNSLLPRLLQAADRGRLRVIGSRDTKIDLTHIDNLVLTLIQAGVRARAGQIYTVTNDDPVSLWPFIEDLLRKTGRPSNLRGISRVWALRAAGWIETWHQWRGWRGEPALTRYTAGLLSTTKTFDISKAKADLDYRPIVSMAEGTRQVIEAGTRRDESPSQVSVKVHLLTTGYTTASAHHAESGASRKSILRFHALIALIEHPVHGMTLFDTGYSPRFFEATQRWPFRVYRWATPVVTDHRLSAVEQLRARGFEPRDVQRIVLSHFHADHTCGLKDFPHADLIATQSSWDAVAGQTGFAALRRAFLPELMPTDIQQRLYLIDQFHHAGFGPFDRSHDLFGDGSVRMFDLSGHARGQIGLLIQRGPQDRVFLTADAAWTTRTIRENLPPTLPFRLLADSKRDVHATLGRLHELSVRFPDIELIPSHCPEVARRYGFDEAIEQIARNEGGDPR